MSMQPHPWPEVPASTAKIAKQAFRKGSLAMRARDELGAWCSDEAFGVTYGTRGAPGISPAQLAMVTILQFTENLLPVQALRRIWIQQFCLEQRQGGEKVIWRGDEQGLPPARSRLVSPYDTDARYAEKRGKGRGRVQGAPVRDLP